MLVKNEFTFQLTIITPGEKRIKKTIHHITIIALLWNEDMKMDTRLLRNTKGAKLVVAIFKTYPLISEIPNDANTTLGQTLIGCLALCQVYCKLIGRYWKIMKKQLCTLSCPSEITQNWHIQTRFIPGNPHQQQHIYFNHPYLQFYHVLFFEG